MAENKKVRGRQVDPQTLVDEVAADSTAREALADALTYDPGIVTGLNQNLQDALNVSSVYSGYYNDGEGPGDGPTDYKGASSTGNVQYTQMELRTAQGHFQIQLFDDGVAQTAFRLGQLRAAAGDSQTYIQAVEDLLLLTTLDGSNGKLMVRTEGDGSDLEVSATGASSDVVITSSSGDVIITAGTGLKVKSDVELGTSAIYTSNLDVLNMTRPAVFKTSSSWLLSLNVAPLDFTSLSGTVEARNDGGSGTKYYTALSASSSALWIARGVPPGAELVGAYVEFLDAIVTGAGNQPALQLVRFRGAAAGSSDEGEDLILASSVVADPGVSTHKYAEVYYGGLGPGVLTRTSVGRPSLSASGEWLNQAAVGHESRPSFGGSGNIRTANYQFGLEVLTGAGGSASKNVGGVVFVFELKRQVP